MKESSSPQRIEFSTPTPDQELPTSKSSKPTNFLENLKKKKKVAIAIGFFLEMMSGSPQIVRKRDINSPRLGQNGREIRGDLEKLGGGF